MIHPIAEPVDETIGKSSQIGFMKTDGFGKIGFVNKIFARLLGVNHEDLQGQYIFDKILNTEEESPNRNVRRVEEI